MSSRINVQVSTALSTNSTASAFIAEKKLFFACDWEFLPAGLALFKNKFQAELKKSRIIAHAKWDKESAFFECRCAREDAVLVTKIFHDVLLGVIRQESGENIDIEDDDFSDTDLSDSELTDTVKQEIRSDKIRRIIASSDEKWRLPTDAEGENKHMRVTEEKKEEEGEEEADDGTWTSDFKLESRTLTPPKTLVGNILWAEESTKFTVDFKTFGQMGQQFFGTTLVDNMDTLCCDDYYNSLVAACTIRHNRTPQTTDLLSLINSNNSSRLRDSEKYVYPSRARATLTMHDSNPEVEKQIELDTGAVIQPHPSRTNKKSSKNAKSPSKANPFEGRLERPEPLAIRQAPPKPDPSIELMSDFKATLHEIMKNVNGGARDGLFIRAELGRIIIRPTRKMKSGTETELQQSAVQGILARCQLQFTLIISIIPTEVRCLIDMEHEGKSMWKKCPISKEVVYQFICKDELAEDFVAFMIEVNAKTNAFKLYTKQEIGVVNVHGLQRSWDFRLVALQQSMLYAKTHEDFAATIKASLITSVTNIPAIGFEIPEQFYHFQVLGVRVRRMTSYASHDQETALSIHEVHELDIREDEDFRGRWKATPSQCSRSGAEWLDFWYEAYITSPKADTILKDNYWNVDSLLEAGVSEALFRRACHVVKHMDPIGASNNNGKMLQRAPVMAKETPPAGEEFIFW